MNWFKSVGFFFVLTFLFALLSRGDVEAKKTIVDRPKDVVVKQQKTHTLKLKWKRNNKASGYKVFRYSAKKKKYVLIKTITRNKHNFWKNRKLKINKTYKYKIAAYKVKKKKTINSKKSYVVSARTYGKKSSVVNVKACQVINDFDLNVYSNVKTKIKLKLDNYSKKAKKPVSKKIRFISSDKSLLKVSSDGTVSTGKKEGKCKLYVIAHNGVFKKIDVKVTNYARPKSFPRYNGTNDYMNLLLSKYKNEVFNIAEFFTKTKTSDDYKTIELNDKGDVIGGLSEEGYKLIKSDVEKLLKEYPLVLKIRYSNGGVVFRMHLGDINYFELVYDKEYSEWWNDESREIAPHWFQRLYIHT